MGSRQVYTKTEFFSSTFGFLRYKSVIAMNPTQFDLKAFQWGGAQIIQGWFEEVTDVSWRLQPLYNPRGRYLLNQWNCLFRKLCIIKTLGETGIFVTDSMDGVRDIHILRLSTIE